MNNLLKERPDDPLNGRNLALINFIGKENIKNKSILDIGCGLGWLEYCLADESKKIIGIDLDKENIKTGMKYVKRKNVSFKVADALKLPIKTRTKDIVVSSEILEHLPKGSEAIFFREVNRVLKNGGFLYLTTPFDNFWAKVFDPAWWLINHRHYSYKKLVKMARENGLSEIKYKVGGRWWSMVGLINLYVSKWIFRRKEFFKRFFDSKEKEEFFRDNGWMNIFVAFKKP